MSILGPISGNKDIQFQVTFGGIFGKNAIDFHPQAGTPVTSGTGSPGLAAAIAPTNLVSASVCISAAVFCLCAVVQIHNVWCTKRARIKAIEQFSEVIYLAGGYIPDKASY